jgi:hypothetical protein
MAEHGSKRGLIQLLRPGLLEIELKDPLATSYILIQSAEYLTLFDSARTSPYVILTEADL